MQNATAEKSKRKSCVMCGMPAEKGNCCQGCLDRMSTPIQTSGFFSADYVDMSLFTRDILQHGAIRGHRIA